MGQWTLQHRLRWFVDHVRRGGFPEVKRRVARYLSPLARAARRRDLMDGALFDASNNYRTNERWSLDGLTLAGDATASAHYEGAATYDIVDAFGLLDMPIHATTFMDIGCGMGRPLLIAADLPFQRIVGVEFARELLDITARNLSQRAKRHGEDIRVELHCLDASDMGIPSGSVAFFFFNSFGPPTLNKFLANVHSSWVACPRPIRFIYVNVQHHAVVESAGFRSRVVAVNRHFTIYEPCPKVASTRGDSATCARQTPLG